MGQLIRRAAQECDAIACLVTPGYIHRPWFYAEWATFWFQEKPWYSLLSGTSPDDLFEVMRRRHVAFLDDRHSVERLFTQLASGQPLMRGFDLLAAEAVQSVADARARLASSRVDTTLELLARLMREGEGNVSASVVDTLLGYGALDAVIRIARDPHSDGAVKRRQLATMLVSRGHAAAAAQFDDLIVNNAECRTVGWACLARLADSPTDEAARQLARSIYQRTREPQRRDLRERADQLRVLIAWPPDGQITESPL